MSQNATNRDKHKNETSQQILANNLSKYHVNTRKVCFPIQRFVLMSLIYKIMTNFCAI